MSIFGYEQKRLVSTLISCVALDKSTCHSVPVFPGNEDIHLYLCWPLSQKSFCNYQIAKIIILQ